MKIPQNKNYDGLTSHYQCTYPNGRVIENTYNNLHQAELVKSDIRGSSALETVADYDYLYDTAGDKRPLLSKMTYDSDTLVCIDFAYDELGRSTKKAWITSAGTGSTVVGFENTYDLYGNRLTDNLLHKSVDSETYLFDSAQRFTKYERGTIGQTPAFTQGYTLDDIGNWSSFDNNGSTESRLYSSTNELTTQGTHSLAYDSNGNSLNSKTHKYIWDELNRLIEVQDNASNTIVTYYYDVHNLRVLKDFGATDEVRYYYCGNKVIEEREYIMGKQYVDEVLVYIDHTGGSAVNYFYMTDLRFSNYAIIDGLGNVIERYKYNGYGEQIVMDSVFTVLGASVVDQFYGYTGRRLDSETGLTYFRARYYDTGQGRFINRDPLGYVDGMGLYNGYFAPRGVDPFGLSYWAVFTGCGKCFNPEGKDGTLLDKGLESIRLHYTGSLNIDDINEVLDGIGHLGDVQAVGNVVGAGIQGIANNAVQLEMEAANSVENVTSNSSAVAALRTGLDSLFKKMGQLQGYTLDVKIKEKRCRDCFIACGGYEEEKIKTYTCKPSSIGIDKGLLDVWTSHPYTKGSANAGYDIKLEEVKKCRDWALKQVSHYD